jgi:hypothetical protein
MKNYDFDCGAAMFLRKVCFQFLGNIAKHRLFALQKDLASCLH